MKVFFLIVFLVLSIGSVQAFSFEGKTDNIQENITLQETQNSELELNVILIQTQKQVENEKQNLRHYIFLDTNSKDVIFKNFKVPNNYITDNSNYRNNVFYGKLLNCSSGGLSETDITI